MYELKRSMDLVFELEGWPKADGFDPVLSSTKKKKSVVAEAVKKNFGEVQLVENTTYEANSGKISVKASIGFLEKDKLEKFLTENEKKINEDGVIVGEGIKAHFTNRGKDYSALLLKESLESGVLSESLGVKMNHVKPSCIDEGIEIPPVNVKGVKEDYACLNEEDNLEKDLITIVETKTGYAVEGADHNADEIYEGDDGIDEDGVELTTEGVITEKANMRRLIRKGKVILKKKTSRPGYKMKSGKEVRMSSKELRERKRAQMKASRKRRIQMSHIQKQRSKSMKYRTKRLTHFLKKKQNKI